MASNIFEELKWRGLIHSYVGGIEQTLATQSVTLYNGFDTTADSLHVGHMVPMIALARFQRFGHHSILLAGGGTSLIGDPSGKSAERQLLSKEIVEANAESIKLQLAHFLDFESKKNPAKLMNNADWLVQLNLIDFFRDIGKHFTVNYMLAKDSVRNRLEREEGLSFTEFSYMLLQSYDFLYLHDHAGCALQTGGSDQWGNITAGAELIRRMRGSAAYGLVYPLITKSDGTKFGKTESGAIWLSAKRTSPYRFYQFWLNTDDRDVVNYLKFFTFLEQPEIEELAQSVVDKPEQRDAQRRLARVMTLALHGETALARAEQASQALFGGDLSVLSDEEIRDVFSEAPSFEILLSTLEGDYTVLDLLVATDLAKSKGDARRSISDGGIYLNNQRLQDPNLKISGQNLLADHYLILRKGRKNYLLVKVLR